MAYKFRMFFLNVITLTVMSMGFVQVSSAGMVSTQTLLDHESRAASIGRLEALMVKEDVAQQLQAYGVEPALVEQRLRGMTSAELLQLEGAIGTKTAGGDAIGVIGTVFLVLLILELVGVTDIFKSI